MSRRSLFSIILLTIFAYCTAYTCGTGTYGAPFSSKSTIRVTATLVTSGTSITYTSQYCVPVDTASRLTLSNFGETMRNDSNIAGASVTLTIEYTHEGETKTIATEPLTAYIGARTISFRTAVLTLEKGVPSEFKWDTSELARDFCPDTAQSELVGDFCPAAECTEGKCPLDMFLVFKGTSAEKRRLGSVDFSMARFRRLSMTKWVTDMVNDIKDKFTTK